MKITFEWDGSEGNMLDGPNILKLTRIEALDFLQDIICETEMLYAMIMADGGVFPGTSEAH